MTDKIRQHNERHLAQLHPELARRLRILLQAAKMDGFTLQIVQGYRSHEEQNALYAKGRTKPGKRVTNARGGFSMHNYKIAADVAFVVNGQISWDEKLYKNIGKWARIAKLEWGGDWVSFKDMPHVQLTNGLTIKQVRALFAKGGFDAVWSKIPTSPKAEPTPIVKPTETTPATEPVLPTTLAPTTPEPASPDVTAKTEPAPANEDNVDIFSDAAVCAVKHPDKAALVSKGATAAGSVVASASFGWKIAAVVAALVVVVLLYQYRASLILGLKKTLAAIKGA